MISDGGRGEMQRSAIAIVLYGQHVSRKRDEKCIKADKKCYCKTHSSCTDVNVIFPPGGAMIEL